MNELLQCPIDVGSGESDFLGRYTHSADPKQGGKANEIYRSFEVLLADMVIELLRSLFSLSRTWIPSESLISRYKNKDVTVFVQI